MEGATVTKKAEAAKEREDAKTHLRELFPPGSFVSTVTRHVSRSGMQRTISVLATKDGEIRDVSWAVARALDWRFDRDRGGVKVNGCGMDMGFHLVHSLSYSIYGEYKCLGKGKCPSSYHNNHRDMIRCDGFEGRHCYKPDPYSSRFPMPEDWPMGERTIEGEGQTFTIKTPLACITDENDENPKVCPTCKGEGQLPNPEGPERFDLTHNDGYALKHRWV
jgi:hypothetical protein